MTIDLQVLGALQWAIDEATAKAAAASLDRRGGSGEPWSTYAEVFREMEAEVARLSERVAATEKIRSRYEWAKAHWAPSDFSLLAWLVADQLPALGDAAGVAPEGTDNQTEG